jgi:hypothetical protein
MEMRKMTKKNAQTEWPDSLKSERTKTEYEDRFAIWLQYCKLKGIPQDANAQILDIQKRRLSQNNTEKYFYDNEIPKFFQWLKTEYKGKRSNKPLSEGSALATTTAIRSFFAHHRYSLDVKGLPNTEHIKSEFEDYGFNIYELRSMYSIADLTHTLKFLP